MCGSNPTAIDALRSSIGENKKIVFRFSLRFWQQNMKVLLVHVYLPSWNDM